VQKEVRVEEGLLMEVIKVKKMLHICVVVIGVPDYLLQ